MVDLDLINPCWEEFSLDLKKMLNMVMYNKLRYFGNLLRRAMG
jgi:hypothetical protein